MRLSSAQEGQVVRNAKNGSHYRYERPERDRVRIRPLELFPNGLLIPKPTDTLVDCDLEVLLVGPWVNPMLVEGRPTRSRPAYERELVQCQSDLVELQAQYALLPPDGKGKQSRGSWANKIKNVENRITVIQQGLGEVMEAQRVSAVIEAALPAFEPNQLVQLPSGLPGMVMSTNAQTATVVTKYMGRKIQSPVPLAILRPWAQARMAA